VTRRNCPRRPMSAEGFRGLLVAGRLGCARSGGVYVRRRKGWEIPERLATPESVWLNRRQIIAAGGAFALASATSASADIDPTASLDPAARNSRYTIDRSITPEAINTNYNNFFEFGLYKQISRAAAKLSIRPWTIDIGGLVDKEFTIAFDDMVRKVQ